MATAVQVESIWNGLTDNSGQPLAAGKVYTYAAGTSTPVSLYTSSDKSTSATNPLVLDGNGKAQVWADGRYKFVVKTAADVTLYTLDNLLYGFDDTTVLLGGISTGSANAQVVSVPATVESYANGQRITFIAGFTNSGATTLKFNNLAAISIVKGPSPSSLQAGDLLAGQLYSCTYYGGSFYLENSPTPADVQRSRAQLITGISGSNTITGALTPAITGYEVGQVFRFKATGANTSAVTLNINGLGAQAVQRYGAALVGGEIQTNDMVEVVYDGTQFQMVNAVPAPLFIDRTNNRVGIGTTAPGTALHVSSSGDAVLRIEGTGGADNDQSVHFKDTTSDWYIGNRYGGGSPSNQSFGIGRTAAKNDVVIDSTGRVGIGAPSTGARLLVAAQGTGGAATEFLQIAQTAAADNVTSRIAFYNYSGIAGAIDSIQNAGSNFQSQLVFSTQTGSGMTEKMRITASGRVGIGRSPQGFFDVINNESNSLNTAVLVSNVAGDVSTAAIIIVKKDNDSTTSQVLMQFLMNGAASGQGQINANGALQAAFGSYSDERLKENIEDLPSQLANIFALRPVEFDYKDGAGHQIGFIAQEVQEVYPDLVGEGKDGFLTLSGLGKNEARMIKAFQEFAQLTEDRIAALEARVAALEA